jgi:hypothetical protein
MKQFLTFLFFLFPLITFSQDKPFEVFAKAIKEEKAGFNGNKENLSKVFNQERIQLGANFEAELWKYLDDDADKHYWISFFVESNSYLHGNTALPELAFRIRQNALKLLENKNDTRSLGRKVNINRKQAIYFHNIGKHNLALINKNVAETILKNDDEVSTYVGAMTRLDSCIYKNLEKDTSFCEAESKKPVEIIVSSGFVTGLAVYLPQPENKGKLKGEVFVKVLISEKGEVLTAEPYQGIKELFDVSIEAAKLAKFSPLLLSGKPTKRSGVIVYKFSNK